MKKKSFSILLTCIILLISTAFSSKKKEKSSIKQASLTEAGYKIYVGNYQMSPTKILTITEENKRLFGEPTGEQKVELHPESKHVFTIKEFKAKVAFIVDPKEEVTQALINLQNKDMVAKKLESK